MNDRDRLNKLRALRESNSSAFRHPRSATGCSGRSGAARWTSRAASLGRPCARCRPSPTRRPFRIEATLQPAPTEAAVQRARAVRRPSTSTRRPGAQGKAGRVRTRAAAADAFIASVRPTPALPEGLLLSLDDSPLPTGDQPWTRGLRG